jgi:hypothetical protein
VAEKKESSEYDPKDVATRLSPLKLPHAYICSACAQVRGAKWPKGHAATCHIGVCPYCEEERSLANIGDWNWPDRKR